ncbi:ATP-binding protein [Methanobrevibacter sp. TMH8]|uniref:ATP-binding protein n=1 Tax=Methanobrevibacter sp. TMH8 TaxID=2848611 RepID=UPI001CC99CBE|nr:ATP-binding protein [Methanobrevibacter sp. TMH8]MBZ9570233.1 ATP-binding protein [Methanobrevibacter sp. TMH8]
MKKNIFPFTAIVGQEKIKKALILNAINPSIGGVLIKGDRGTGKTTAVRALANLLPEIEVVEGCSFNCDEDSYREFELYKVNDKSADDDILIIKKPMSVVELPLGATEDRVVGSLDIEKALKEGIKALEPGLLAQTNRNILYIDEINLLDDNLVDILLDAAAFGVNTIEREGISISHPSRFILVGTMNPEEGELRGQLSDRIGLEIEVEGIGNIDDRILIMKRREEFEMDPASFIAKFDDEQKELQNRIIEAQKLLNNVEIDSTSLEIIARITLELGAEGHRSDISILKTSKTIAAFNNHLKVDDNDLEEAISLVLGNDKLLSQRIQKIKKDIEKRDEENSSDSLEGIQNKIEEQLQESLQKKLQDINQNTDFGLDKEKTSNKSDIDDNNSEDIEDIEKIDLGNNKSKKLDFVNDSDFKIKDEFDSKINQGEKIENFNDIDIEGKLDIKKY